MSQLYVDNIRNRTGGPIGIPTGAVVTGVLTATTGNITGNMTVGGVLTYEDVTNIDSVGIITAQSGIRIGAGESIGSDGADAVFYGDGSNLNNLDAANISSGTLPDARFPATLPAVSGENLTNLTAGNLTGTISNDRLPNPVVKNLTGDVTGDLTGNSSTATILQTSRSIGGVSFNGSADINLPGVNQAGTQDTSGNAATATTLQNARTIGGVSFDGSADINLPGVNQAGTQDTSGNAATATTLATARSINGTSFDGSADIVVGRIPQNSQTSSYTLVVGDAGKHVNITTGGVTVPSGVFSVGDAVSIYNDSASNQTITQGTSVTLREAGTANTGNRTLAQRGICTVLCVATNEFVITGAGLS